jgi:Sel1 repeat
MSGAKRSDAFPKIPANALLHRTYGLQGRVMPSSDRKPKRDRPDQKTTARESGRGRHAHRPIQPPQYFDPDEPWDVQSAEALTHLYESGEGYVPQGPDDKRGRPLPAQQSSTPESRASQDPGGIDRAWLDARLAEVTDKLQASLAKINPDKTVEQLTHRLDAIEERFKEVLDRVAQRSDLDGLKLIEAHVVELSAHIEQTRGRLDRIDTLDQRVESIARKLEEGDHQRLDALEQMLQDYVSEWRNSNSRTAAALQQLEGTVARVGDTLEALEAHKPVPDMSLSMLDATGPSAVSRGTDPISQVYAEAARSLEPDATQDILDAANYAPNTEPARGEIEDTSPRSSAAETQESGLDRATAVEGSSSLRSIRDKLRQAGLLGPDDDNEDPPADERPREERRTSKPSLRIRRFGPNMLLGGGILVFGIIGYLLVNVLMARPAVHHVGAGQHSSRPASTETAADEAIEENGRVPSTTGARMLAAPPRIEGISAMAAAFRGKEIVSPPETAAADVPGAAAYGEGEVPLLAMLPMTIGPASLRQAALRGEQAAQIEVAARFAAGHGVERDLSQALQWYTRAAAQGSAVAQYRLGAFYERGWGVPADLERARVWYARAAEQGNVKAIHNLGVLAAAGGRGDLAAAAVWFAKAAEFGLPDSQINLAILHQNGLGLPKDLVRAYKWLALAARAGDREALARIDSVRAQLSPAELATGDGAVSVWRARTPDAAANEPPATLSREGGR